MRTSFHHQPEAQHPNFPLSASWQADYPIFRGAKRTCPNTGVKSANGPTAVIGPTEIPQRSGLLP